MTKAEKEKQLRRQLEKLRLNLLRSMADELEEDGAAKALGRLEGDVSIFLLECKRLDLVEGEILPSVAAKELPKQ